MIAIIAYNAGNVKSVENAVKQLGYQTIITDNTSIIQQSDKVIFPGVGEASTAMNYLKQRALDTLIISLKQPVMGICLGLQLMCNFSEEGNTTCMGIFDVEVKKFPPFDLVPHMGWNNLTKTKGKLFKNIAEEDDFYFVHSYYANVCKHTAAICNYITPFSAVLQKDNFFATQFHPEKSANVGQQLLKNFLSL